MARILLAGDIGATKALLALFQAGDGAAARPAILRKKRYASAEYPGLERICAEFLSDGVRVDAAGFGVPGVVALGTAEPINLAWKLDAKQISAALGGAPVRLLNDLATTALGVVELTDSDYETIQENSLPEATARSGNVAVIAAGTGLGEAALACHDGRYYPVVSEGGHSSFAPEDEEQIELLGFLQHEFGHVSWERVLSGPGLVNLYRFLRARSGVEEPAWLGAALAGGDPAAAISAAAESARDRVCIDALTMFCAIYGAEAANLALKVLALGGVYLCGGIAAKILPWLERGEFARAFAAKGRLAPMLGKIAVRVVVNPDVAVFGAAHSALAMLC
ncbi:MAG TPA: glucokinase [Candidatus Binataceae bacterium]|nr:glucokinase [Candidatus Binataceae bacterium]